MREWGKEMVKQVHVQESRENHERKEGEKQNIFLKTQN